MNTRHLLTKNPLFIERTRNIGELSAEDAIRWGITGPMLRASGIAHDLRKAQPYSGYEQYDFDIPTHTDGDTYARYLVRMEEMRQSLRIVQQALDKLPSRTGAQQQPQIRPAAALRAGHQHGSPDPPLQAVDRRLSSAEGRVYVAVESPRGELGVYLESDGGPQTLPGPLAHPIFANLQILPLLSKGHLVADLVALIGTIDIVLGDV